MALDSLYGDGGLKLSSFLGEIIGFYFASTKNNPRPLTKEVTINSEKNSSTFSINFNSFAHFYNFYCS